MGGGGGGSITGMIMSLANVGVERATIKANNMLSQVNAESQNKVRQASNAAKAAQGSLDRWMQSVNNNRILEQGGNNMEASVVNYRRQVDANMYTRFSDQVSRAEQQGAAYAAQAASGVGGSVVDMVNGATAIRNSLIQQRTDDVLRMSGHDAAKAASGVMRHAIGSMNTSLLVDTFDTNINVSQRAVPPSYGPYVMGGIEMAVKAYFGIPPSGDEMSGDKGKALEQSEKAKQGGGGADMSRFNFDFGGGSNSFDFGAPESSNSSSGFTTGMFSW
jgi:hypothetical protein